MTLIDFFRAFMDSVEAEGMTSSEQLVYFHLLYRGNVKRFTEWFRVSDRNLADRAGISKNSVTEAKNRLKQKGYIDFKTVSSNGKNSVTKYWIIHRFGTPTGTPTGTTTGTPTGTTAGDYIRIEKNRIDKTSSNMAVIDTENRLISFWQNNFNPAITHREIEQIYSLTDDYDEEKILDAMQYSLLKGGRSVAYVAKVLERRKETGKPAPSQKGEKDKLDCDVVYGSPEWIRRKEEREKELAEFRRTHFAKRDDECAG